MNNKTAKNKITLLDLVLQNIRRKPYRVILIGVCVALATGSLFAITIIMSSVQNALEVGQARLGADLVVVPAGYEISAQESFITGEPSIFYFNREIETKVASLDGIAATSAQVYVKTLSNAPCCTGEFFLVGFDPQTDFTISPWLATHLGNKVIQPTDIIVGDRILLNPGDSYQFYGSDFIVAGVLEKTGMGIDRTIYVPMPGIRSMIEYSDQRAIKEVTVSPDEISAVMVKVNPNIDIIDIAELIEANIKGVQAFTASQLNQAVNQQLQGILGIVMGITIALWLMSLAVIGLVFSLVINERQRELGLLRAMGAKRKFIFNLVISEATLLTGISGLAGVFSALIILLGFSRLIQNRLHIPYLMPAYIQVAGVAIGLLVMAILAGGLASLLPARNSSKMDIYEAIRQGE